MQGQNGANLPGLSGMVELSDEELDEVGGGSLASSIGYAIGYCLQTSATYYATHDAMF